MVGSLVVCMTSRPRPEWDDLRWQMAHSPKMSRWPSTVTGASSVAQLEELRGAVDAGWPGS